MPKGDLENIEVELQGDLLHITIDLSETGRPSAKGKSNVVASTHGFSALDALSESFPNDRLSLNHIRYPERE